MYHELTQALFRIGAIRFGQFTLKDGRTSPFYIDLRTLVAEPAVLREAARAMLERARPLSYERLAGLPYAGLPIAVAMALAGDIPLIYPRKEAKTHGTRQTIEGSYRPGERVLVVDDVITSGSAKLEAVQPLRDAGLVAEHVLVLIDRSRDAAALLGAHGLQLHSVMRVERLLQALRGDDLITGEQFDRATAFLGGPA